MARAEPPAQHCACIHDVPRCHVSVVCHDLAVAAVVLSVNHRGTARAPPMRQPGRSTRPTRLPRGCQGAAKGLAAAPELVLGRRV